jgi:prepilin-type N-terminal cleavage/methylation domain-containing protein
MERKKQKRKAFTLIELLVVIIILSMLAAFTAPKLFQYVGKSKRDLAKPKLALVEGAIGPSWHLSRVQLRDLPLTAVSIRMTQRDLRLC